MFLQLTPSLVFAIQLNKFYFTTRCLRHGRRTRMLEVQLPQLFKKKVYPLIYSMKEIMRLKKAKKKTI